MLNIFKKLISLLDAEERKDVPFGVYDVDNGITGYDWCSFNISFHGCIN